ncbi:bifunctional serine/threonine-protein kinase/ABC transporter substrate-binding protein [Streptomyces sp. NPDC059256]|uniref:bifunctional serine/threonine-protein kinase/ABC transporter substrate-binding protein n=1 Tax=Streptomyces sp. NPDC059256 TaxID=3346794 RepID=UPI0036792E2D
MEPLRTGDPSSIAGYRLLGRLGAGGMGVVYLGRSDRGALAAIKVIRAEHAADPGFRARFRRETETARRITGRWVVRVVGADPEAREPWLATEFVPGPSLSEAVAVHGALPEHTVRALGVRLAEALTDVHRTGLVHRDVKPGNVLLALDGPRLIDFGIARSAGATALTATDAMIGSPGYLSPEQAKLTGEAEIGSASDVFSLGCVLAYATTGRRPFGSGTVAAIVFRTVHEEPDLDGIPPALLALVRACLNKDPAERPTAAQVRAGLRGPGAKGAAPGRQPPTDAIPDRAPAAGTVSDRAPAADAVVPDPREAFGRAPETGTDRATTDGGEGTGPDRTRNDEPPVPSVSSVSSVSTEPDGELGTAAGDWLPEGLPALIAQRSSRVLDLPVPEPTVVVPARSERPSRRRFLLFGSAAAVATAGGAAAWLANRPSNDGTGVNGGRKGPLPRHLIGIQTDLSGPHRADGRAQELGARLAVKAFNARRDRPFDLGLTVLDDAGDPGRAVAVADRLLANASVVAGLGLTNIAVARAVLPRYTSRQLPVLSVVVGTGTLALPGATSYFELRPVDNMLITPVNWYFALRGTRRVAAIEDGAGDQASWNIGRALRDTKSTMGDITFSKIAADSDDFASVVRDALATGPDGVVYVGNSPARAALAARALRDQGFTGPRGAIQPVLDQAFLTGAGPAAEGWVFGTTYADATQLKGAENFCAAYRRLAKTSTVERFAVEAYDAVHFIARGIEELNTDRFPHGALQSRLRTLAYSGVGKSIAFRSTTTMFDEAAGRVGMYLHRIEGGRARFLGPYLQVTAGT